MMKKHLAKLVGSGLTLSLAIGCGGSLNTVPPPGAGHSKLVAPVSLPSPARANAATAVSGDLVYVLGGHQGDGYTCDDGALANASRYDAAKAVWSDLPALDTARCGPVAAMTSAGDLFVVGGGDGVHALSSGAKLSAGATQWTAIAPMSTARMGAAATLGSDGRLYVVGGLNEQPLATLEAYDPATNTWETLPPMPTPRFGLMAYSDPAGHIYAAGGGTGSSYLQAQSSNVVEIYDIQTKTWTTGAPLPEHVFGAGVGQETASGKVYFVGGQDLRTGSSPADQVVAFMYSASTGGAPWTAETALPNARFLLSAAVTQAGTVVAVGGYYAGLSSETDTYDPATKTWLSAGAP